MIYLSGLVFTFIFLAVWARVFPSGEWAAIARIVCKDPEEWKLADDHGMCIFQFIIAIMLWPITLCFFTVSFLLICWRKAAALSKSGPTDKGNTS